MISIRNSLVLVLTIGVVIGMIVPSVALAATQSSPSAIDESQVYEVSNGGQVHAWERAGFTLRTDDTSAPSQVPAPAQVFGQTLGSKETFGSGNNGGDSQTLIQDFGERNALGVHNSGEDVTLAFRPDYATGSEYDKLDGQQNVDIVAARLTPQDGKSVPTDTQAALDLLSDIDKANKNASFEMLKNDIQLNSDGTYSVTERYTPGHYVLFAAVHEGTGFSEKGGDISVTGDVTIVGVEQLSVQENSASVTPPSDPEPGDSLNFNVDSKFSSGNDITHAVAVYNASTFENSRFDLVIDQSEIDSDFDYTTDAELEPSINGVNGVADVEDGLTLNGNDLSDGEVRRPVDASSIVDFLAEEAGTSNPQVNPIEDGGESETEYEQIDASVTAINGANPVADVTVDTFANFSEGKYRYVVVSTLDDDESRISTAAGSIQINNDTDRPRSRPSNNNGGGGVTDNTAAPGTPDPVITTPVQSADGTTTGSALSVDAGQTIVLDVPADTNASDQAPVLEQLNVTSTEDASFVQVSVKPSTEPTDGTPANDRGTTTLGYLNVNTQGFSNPDQSPGSFKFRVSEQRLSELGKAPSNVVMYRYSGGSWNAIETTYLGGNRYRADTPGFSWFAIGTADAEVSVSEASLSSTSADTGESVNVTATLENTGDVAGNVTLTFTANGEEVESRTVSVDAGDTVVETYSFSSSQSGDYDIAVNGVSAGTVSVQGETQSPGSDGNMTQTPRDGDSEGAPLLIIGIVIVALILVGAAAYTLRE